MVFHEFGIYVSSTHFICHNFNYFFGAIIMISKNNNITPVESFNNFNFP